MLFAWKEKKPTRHYFVSGRNISKEILQVEGKRKMIEGLRFNWYQRELWSDRKKCVSSKCPKFSKYLSNKTVCYTQTLFWCNNKVFCTFQTFRRECPPKRLLSVNHYLMNRATVSALICISMCSGAIATVTIWHVLYTIPKTETFR